MFDLLNPFYLSVKFSVNVYYAFSTCFKYVRQKEEEEKRTKHAKRTEDQIEINFSDRGNLSIE